jgi:hypothetical protein
MKLSGMAQATALQQLAKHRAASPMASQLVPHPCWVHEMPNLR